MVFVIYKWNKLYIFFTMSYNITLHSMKYGKLE